jgi:hypothetical protein
MKNLFFIIMLMAPLLAVGQSTISGTVKENGTSMGIPFATIILSDSQNNRLAVVETDEHGNFKLEVPASFASGILSISYLGFITFTQDITGTNLPQQIDAVLLPQQTELAEVVVNARHKAVTLAGDKIIYNVGAAGIGDGNNGLETLALLPGMKLDKDDNPVFRGSSDIQIMINGKKSLLSGDALREYIRSLKGSDIASVEIIAQPSARYEAAGTAGIINIILKKNRAPGLTGNISTAAYCGEYFKSRQGGRIFYSDSLWTLSANGSYYNGKSVNHRHIKQSIQLDEGEKIIDQYNEWLPVTVSSGITMAAERKLSKNETLSTEWQYSDEKNKESTNGFTNEFLNGMPLNTVSLIQRFDNTERRVTGNIFYNFTSDSTTTKLDLQANFARYRTRQGGYQQNRYSNGNNLVLAGNNKTAYTIANVQADLTLRLSEKVNLEAGAKYALVKMDYYNRYAANDTELVFIPDSLLVNDFRYDENLASAYTQASGNFGKWNIQSGVRAEYYQFTARSQVNHKVNSGRYLNLFPSFSVSYKQDNNQYQFNYSRRIGRPGYLSLNPYYQYLDAYTLNVGNPALKPQYYNSFQLSYIYKSMLSLSLYGYLYDDGFTQVIDYQRDANYNLTYQANAAKGSRFGFSATLPYQPVKWWTSQLSLDAYTASEKSDLDNFAYNGTGYGYDINLYQNVELKGDWKLNMTAFYTGRATAPNGFSRATYDFSLSGKKTLFDKKLQVAAGCSNILKKSLYNHTTKVNGVSTDWINRWETRRFFVQLTYFFGSGKTKEIRGSSLDEETERIQ